MTKRKGEGPYHNNPDKESAREMEKERTRPKTCADGVSWADVLDRNSGEESNFGLAASVKRPKR
jgi:hypothetical protein